MRISTGLVATLIIIGGVAGPSARAQTGNGSPISEPKVAAQTRSKTPTVAATMKAQARGGTTSSLKKAPDIPTLSNQNKTAQKSSSRKIPPAPPIVGRGISRQGSSRKKVSTEDQFVADPSGRKDLAGRPVAFYPSARSLTSAKNQQSATAQHKPARPRDNPLYKKDNP